MDAPVDRSSSIDMNPDLAQERRRATFDPEQVTSLLYRGPENVRKRRYLRTYSVYVLLTRLLACIFRYMLHVSGPEGGRGCYM